MSLKSHIGLIMSLVRLPFPLSQGWRR